MDGGESLSDFEAHFAGEDIFSILRSLESDETSNIPPVDELLASQKPIVTTCSSDHLAELEEAAAPKRKRQKLSSTEEANLQREDQHGQQRMAHKSVERNRRKQMNQHVSLLRSLIPAFYVQRGDQASIIGGVAAYITELQQVLQSLEAKKQRKLAYSKLVLSPRLNNIVSNNYSPVLSPRKPPLSPRVLSLPIGPRTPQPTSPYKTRLQQGYRLSSPLPSPSPSSSSSTSSINDSSNELAANSKSAIAVVEVKFSGPNVLLKTVSPWIPGQAAKIIAALEGLSLEILHVSISTIDETTLNSFTIKIGVECQLSAEELAQQIQRTFC